MPYVSAAGSVSGPPSDGPAFGLDVGVTNLRLAFADSVAMRPEVSRCCSCCCCYLVVPIIRTINTEVVCLLVLPVVVCVGAFGSVGVLSSADC